MWKVELGLLSWRGWKEAWKVSRSVVFRARFEPGNSPVVTDVLGKTFCKFKYTMYAVYKLLVYFTQRRYRVCGTIKIYIGGCKFFATLQPRQLQAKTFLWPRSYMCLLPQTSGHVSYKILSFFHCRYLPTYHVSGCPLVAHNYTSFVGLGESPIERKRGSTLHGQGKCSQADSPLIPCFSICFSSRNPKKLQK
jgi:hypothetical protein